MSKAIEGAAMLGGAVAMGVAAFLDPALVASPLFDKIWVALVLGGISLEAGAIAGALTTNRGTNITTRQAAAFRQIIYGIQRVGGVVVYQSTTGGNYDQYNYVIVLAGHGCAAIENLYLDGRQVFWEQGSFANTTRNGVNFGGSAGGGTKNGPSGAHYNFDTLVFCEARYGDQVAGDVMTSLNANDPTWAPSASGSPYLGGCTYVYVKIEYDTAMFPSPPEMRFTVHGKNNIYDPRTGTTGYTSNWALCVADVLTDTVFGLGDVGSVNTEQLIAAANVCDEEVALAAGGTELRYAMHWHYDTATAPGDALQTMMTAAAGRLSRIGGEWYLWPAYWQGPSFSFDASALTGPVEWMPNRSFRDLCNVITGTYIAPNYPYNDAGNLYDANGWYYGTLENNFPFAFQPTNYPEYALDTLHGYATDEYLAEDGGVRLPREIAQQCVLSVAQAQRVAKIYLLRNRQQGSGTLKMHLTAYQMQPVDVMLLSFPANGWAGKMLEITSTGLRFEEQEEAVAVLTEFGVQETAPSVYEWSTTEELTVYDVPASPLQAPYTPAPPTNLSVISSAATALVGTDGIVRPRAEITWDTPMDVLVTALEIQYQTANPTGPWMEAGYTGAAANLVYVGNVVSGVSYNFQMRSLRPNGAASAWVGVGPEVISATTTSIVSTALNPNSPYNIGNNATVDSIAQNGQATVRIYGPGGLTASYTRFVGSAQITMLAAQITGAAFTTQYFVVYDAVGLDYLLITDFNQTLSDNYVFIGTLTTCASTYTGTGTTGGGSTGGGSGNPGGGRAPIERSNQPNSN